MNGPEIVCAIGAAFLLLAICATVFAVIKGNAAIRDDDSGRSWKGFRSNPKAFAAAAIGVRLAISVYCSGASDRGNAGVARDAGGIAAGVTGAQSSKRGAASGRPLASSLLLSRQLTVRTCEAIVPQPARYMAPRGAPAGLPRA